MPQASADDTICIGNLVTGTYDTVIVPEGANCFFASGVRINGDLIVESNATVFDFTGPKFVTGSIKVASGAILHLHRVSVDGNVQATDCKQITFDRFNSAIGNVQIDGCEIVHISRSNIGGDVQVKNSGSGFVRMIGDTIGGDLQIEDNSGSRIAAWSNSVAGDLQYSKNTSTTIHGPSTVGSNIVGGNLQCFDNTPSASIFPFGLNTVTGDKQGECEFL